MDYRIRVFKVDKEDSRLRGFVSITFENAFCVKSIALKQSAKGNFYLEMPKYQDYESQEYLPFFNFKDAEFRKAVTEQVVKAYGQIDDKYVDVEETWGDEELYYDLSVTPIKGNDTFKAEAAMKIHDVFVVQQMHVIQGWNGKTFVGMPQTSQKGDRVDISHPVSADFKAELETAIMDEYHRKLEVQQKSHSKQPRSTR